MTENKDKNKDEDVVYILRQDGWDSVFSKIEALDKKIKGREKRDLKDNTKED